MEKELLESLNSDMLVMRGLDISQRYEVRSETVLLELNIRFVQYLSNQYSIQFIIIQCIEDFNRWVTPLQKDRKTIKYDLPVCCLKSGLMIYANPFLTKEDFKEGSATTMFTTEKVTS